MLLGLALELGVTCPELLLLLRMPCCGCCCDCLCGGPLGACAFFVLGSAVLEVESKETLRVAGREGAGGGCGAGLLDEEGGTPAALPLLVVTTPLMRTPFTMVSFFTVKDVDVSCCFSSASSATSSS